MSKIICDVCGTSYPETAAQCPICGCAKPVDAQASNADSSRNNTGFHTYTYVKGGRFSKANVRKRNKANQSDNGRRDSASSVNRNRNDRGETKSNRGLDITLIVLLLAIVAIVIYLAVRFFLPASNNPQNNPPATGGTTATDPTPAITDPSYPCTDLILTNTVVELDELDEAYLLNVTPVPENTTDHIAFESSDPSVAIVSSEGCVTAVAPGQVIITITCGDITKECTVVCTFETEPTEPPTEATSEPTEPDEPFELNRSDITMSYKGEEWQLYSGSISKLSIIWTSDDPNVATIEGGLVTAVGPGMTEVHGEYNGQIVTCIIRCSF